MIEASGVPPGIDALLHSIGRRTGLSPSVLARLNSIGRSVVRAWLLPAVDRGEIGKAIYKIGRCLEVEGASPAGADAAVFPELERLSAMLEASLTSPAAPRAAPAIPPPLAPPQAVPPPAFTPRSAEERSGPASIAAPPSAESVDDLLLLLERNQGLPAPLSKAINTVFLHVLRPFEQSPPDRRGIADALDRVKQCLTIARAEPRDPRIDAAIANLVRLSRLLESCLATASDPARLDSRGEPHPR